MEYDNIWKPVIAPELKGNDYDFKVDVYTIGTLLYHILIGR